MYSPWLRRRADHCFKCKLEQLNALRMSSAVILLVYAVMHSLCCWCELTVNYSGPCWDTTHVKPDFSFISSPWRKCWSYRMLELVVLQAPPQGCLSQVKVQLMRFIWLPEKEYIYTSNFWRFSKNIVTKCHQMAEFWSPTGHCWPSERTFLHLSALVNAVFWQITPNNKQWMVNKQRIEKTNH